MTTMTARELKEPSVGKEPYRMRLPGFVGDEDVGLGDAIKRVTYGFGIKPCGGCERRAAAFNRWLAFSGPRRQSMGSRNP